MSGEWPEGRNGSAGLHVGTGMNGLPGAPPGAPPPNSLLEGRQLRTSRRALPTGRAVIGAFLMTAAAVAVFGAWSTASRTSGRAWVVATRSLPAGSRLTAGDLRTETFQLPRGATAEGSFSQASVLVGRTLAAPLVPGELVETTGLVRRGGNPPFRPVTVSIGPADSGDLAPGRLVDVLVTEGSGSSASTAVVVRGAVVLNLTSGATTTFGGSGQIPVTLGVKSFPEVAALVEAQQAGTLSVVIGEPADGQGLGPGHLLPTSRDSSGVSSTASRNGGTSSPSAGPSTSAGPSPSGGPSPNGGGSGTQSP